MKRIIKIVLYLGFAYTFLNFITPYSSFLLNRSIKNQINYLNHSFDKKLDDKMQSKFPEGKIFSNAIFCLSLIEYQKKSNADKKHTAQLVDKRISRLMDSSTTQIFNKDLDLQYGIFYSGWLNYTLKSYIESASFEYSEIKNKILQKRKALNQAIESSMRDSVRILDTYSDSNWPADNLVGLISIDDELLKKKWLNEILKVSQHTSGLIHHEKYEPNQIRGSSQALIIYLLSHYNTELANQNNQKFKELLVAKVLSLQFVMEFESHIESYSDYDSGPVVLDYGAVATIMNIKTQARLGQNKPKSTWGFLSSISFPINIANKKFYLFKAEPMYDIFMLWCSVELL